MVTSSPGPTATFAPNVCVLSIVNSWARLLWLRGCLYVWLCPTLCSSAHCSPPDSSVNGIFHARIQGWVAISYSRGSSWPRDWTVTSCVSCIGWQILYQLRSPRGHLGECNFSTSRRQGEDMGERSVLRRPRGVLFGYTRGESVSLPFHFQSQSFWLMISFLHVQTHQFLFPVGHLFLFYCDHVSTRLSSSVYRFHF